ncbi:MAG: TonB-dependent receptor [Myxococcota bacterium]|nr:TonB-dependent receptor [Myxococcota bacterium]
MLPSLLPLVFTFPALAEEDASAPEEVIVEAERYVGRESWDTPAAMTVFLIEESLRPGLDLGSIVEQAPGVQIQRFGDADDFQGVSIRGSSMRQVQLYLDGIPLNPEGGRAVNLSEWPIRALERVEVFRGYAPASLGGAAIGGAIDLIPRDAQTPISTGLSTSRYERYSADVFTGRLRETTTTRHSTSFFTQGHTADGTFPFFTDNGTPYERMDDGTQTRTNNESAQGNILGRYKVEFGPTTLTLINAFLARSEGLPGHINNPSKNAALQTQRNLLGLQAKALRGKHVVTATSWWSHRDETYDDRADELGLGSQWANQRSENLGMRLYDQWFVSEFAEVGFGASARVESANSTDLLAEGVTTQHDRTVETATAHLRFDQGKLGLEGTAHATFLQYPQTDTPPDSSIDPRMAVIWRWGDHRLLRATAGHYMRPPDLDEIFGDRGSLLGNPNLKPEQGWQWDLGLRSHWPQLKHLDLIVDISHFWNAGTDRITWVQNSQKTMMPVNFGRTWVQGLEGSLLASSEFGFQSHTSLALTQSTNLDPDPAVANKQLPSTPTWSVWEEVSFTSPQELMRLAYSYRFIDGNFVDATNWFRSAPRSLHDVSIQFHPGKRWPLIQAGVSNLFNKQAEVVPQNPLQPATSARVVQPLTDFAGHPLPGRVWTLNLRWTPGGLS